MATHEHDHGHAPAAGHGAHATGAAHGVVHHHHVGHDKRPAFVGLIVGGIAIFAIMWGTVLLTNKQFEGHGAPGAKPAAQGTAPAAGH